MPKYTSPNPGDLYDIKLIRVRDVFYSTAPGDKNTLHTALADQEGITDLIRELMETDPRQVDGLRASVILNKVIANGDSATLRLPVVDEAREITLQMLQEQTPGFEIKGRPGYTVYEGSGNTPAEKR